MTSQTLYILLIIFIVFEFLVSFTLSLLNKSKWSNTLPKEAEGIYDEEKYANSMKYEKVKHTFGTITSVFSFILLLILVIFGIFGELYNYIVSFGFGEIITTLIFFAIIGLIQSVLMLPFSYYKTFVIEQNFGFNKMSKATFFTDFIKGLVLSAVIGGLILSLLTFLYLQTGSYFWIIAWLVLSIFSLLMMMFYSSVIVPIFNKQTPLAEGELRTAIEAFGNKMGFKIDNIFVIDGSKRSSKANAYFSGLGPKKRIVLFDTLIKDLTTDEIVAVLAHEIGHYQKKHTLEMLVFSIAQTGFMLFILGLSLKYSEFSLALGGEEKSFALAIIAFSILFSPISMILGIIGNVLSRKNEYEADEYAAQHDNPKALNSALIKLSRKNLSNLAPHPAYEFFYYSHPVVLKRLAALTKHI